MNGIDERHVLWLDRSLEHRSDPLPDGVRFDDLVVGAGLAGLVTAVLLARAGRSVCVLEARHAGAVTTGRTTAKVSLLQGTKLSALRGLQSEARVHGYVEANREGRDWLRGFCRDQGVAVQERAAATYAATAAEVATVREEYDAARAAGLGVRWHDELPVPFPVHAAVVLERQLQLDPMDLVSALVGDLRAHGGLLHQGQRVTGISARGTRVRLDDASTVAGRTLVLATGTPVADRGGHFAMVEPGRSYLLAYRHSAPPELMCISAGRSRRSVRDVPAEEGDPVLLVGGSGHPVGRTHAEPAHLGELRAWTARHFSGAVETHAWSAQDYTAYSGLPIVGPLLPGLENVQVITGFDKWGMTAAVAAGLAVSARLRGGGNDGAPWTTPVLPGPRSLARCLRINAGAVGSWVTGALMAEARPLSAPPAGGGAVGRYGGLPTAATDLDGTPCRLRAVCTHLGGVLRWNAAERSWDCPLHGSRFDADGTVLEGPATRPLPPVS